MKKITLSVSNLNKYSRFTTFPTLTISQKLKIAAQKRDF